MFACEKCNTPMEVEETSNKVDPGRCRRERQCPACGYVCQTTEVSDAVYKAAVRKAAVALAKQMVADLREILAAAQVDFGPVLRRSIETARITGKVHPSTMSSRLRCQFVRGRDL